MIAALCLPGQWDRTIPRLIASFSFAEVASAYLSSVADGYERVIEPMLLGGDVPNLNRVYDDAVFTKLMEARPRVVCGPASKACYDVASANGYSIVLIAPHDWSSKQSADHLHQIGWSDDEAQEYTKAAAKLLEEAPRKVSNWEDVEDFLRVVADEGGDYLRMRGIQDEIVKDVLMGLDEQHNLGLFDRERSDESTNQPLDDEELGKEVADESILEDESDGGIDRAYSLDQG